MRAYVLCAGRGERWKADYPKQLASVECEPILHRTVRLLSEACVDDVTVVSWDQRLAVPGSRLRHSPPSDQLVQTLCDIAGDFSEDGTLLLLGDVYYTPEAVKTIVEAPGEVVFFGREHGSFLLTGCPWPEFFAARIGGTGRDVFGRKLEAASGAAREQGRGKLWDVLESDRGADEFVAIEDLTEDFDTTLGFRRWMRRYRLYKATPPRLRPAFVWSGQKAEWFAERLFWRLPSLFAREEV